MRLLALAVAAATTGRIFDAGVPPWAGTRWLTLASTTAPVGAPAGVVGTATGSAAAALCSAPENALFLSVVPIGANGAGAARVAVDLAEVRVRLHLP